MKQIIYLVLSITCFQCFSQTHKAVYSAKIEANPITGDTSFGDEVNPLLENNEFYLYFDKEQSYYTSKNVENNQKDMSDAVGMSYDPIKYNFKSNSFEINVEADKLYKYIYTSNVNWEITNETKEIAGYTCIKANGIISGIINPNQKFNIIAWFAPEVAYPVGPGRYAGLPGIIVYSVFQNYYIYKLESIKFNDNSLDINSIEYQGEPMTQEQYIEYLKS